MYIYNFLSSIPYIHLKSSLLRALLGLILRLMLTFFPFTNRYISLCTLPSFDLCKVVYFCTYFFFLFYSQLVTYGRVNELYLVFLSQTIGSLSSRFSSSDCLPILLSPSVFLRRESNANWSIQDVC